MKKNRCKTTHLLSPALLLFFSPIIAHAAIGNTEYAYGAVSKGMGGANTALPSDALTPALNPAGITYLQRRLDVGAELLLPESGYTANPFVFPGGVAPG